MVGAMVKMDDDGMDRLFGELARKLEKVDASIRTRYTGRPAEEIEPVAVEEFTKAGINFTGSMREYAESVERNEDFRLDLG